MACYHPLKGFKLPLKTVNGKDDYKITGYDAECVVSDDLKTWDALDFIPTNSHSVVITESIDIPCGQCIGCRLKRSRDWATRCMLESKYHENSSFLTLTYSDDNLPFNDYIDVDGVINHKSTLVKDDLQRFWKRLRKNLDSKGLPKIRYFGCGEYGSQTARPHYHAIVFGLDVLDKKEFRKSGSGFMVYTSEWLNSIWKNGLVFVGSVTFESCQYVAKYVVKKLTGDNADVYERYNFEPEFNVFSNRPGIGRDYFDSHAFDIYKNDELILTGGKTVPPPRYFDKCMDSLDEELMNGVKDRRADVAEALKSAKLRETSLSYQDVLKAEERNVKRNFERFQRKGF